MKHQRPAAVLWQVMSGNRSLYSHNLHNSVTHVALRLRKGSCTAVSELAASPQTPAQLRLYGEGSLWNTLVQVAICMVTSAPGCGLSSGIYKTTQA
ncbi:MAG: hypothetical protein ACI8PT_001866 [Gammaproteobacteria bacterium]|jgi:hypothetical protein